MSKLQEKYELLLDIIDELSHALEHVTECEKNCDDCRYLAGTALARTKEL